MGEALGDMEEWRTGAQAGRKAEDGAFQTLKEIQFGRNIFWERGGGMQDEIRREIAARS